MSSENIDVRSLAQIYKSGDLLLDNPAETCIIFVSVIIVSAGLEFLLQTAQTRIDNKYIRMIVDTLTQELTILGILALFLMLATSLAPAGEQQDRYSTLFTWANMNLLFMAIFYISLVIGHFFWMSFEGPRWRTFEEGRMDSEEADTLAYRERCYKGAFERYGEELFLFFNITPTHCAFHESVQVYTRRLLVRMGSIPWRIWASLIPAIVLNGVRARFLSFDDDAKHGAFLNALIFMGFTGYLSAGVFLAAAWMLQGRLADIIYKRVARSTVGADYVPLGSPRRFIELIQAAAMNINWYTTLFITGIGRNVASRGERWEVAVVSIIFVLPILAVHAAIPWTMHTLSMMSVLGSLERNKDLIAKIIRRHRGEDVDDEELDDEEVNSDEEEELRKNLDKKAAEARKKRQKERFKQFQKSGGKGPPRRPGGPNGPSPPAAASGGKMPSPAARPPPPGGVRTGPPPQPLAMPLAMPAAPQLQGGPSPPALPQASPEDASLNLTMHADASRRPGWLDEAEEWGGGGDDDGRYDPFFFENVDVEELHHAMREVDDDTDDDDDEATYEVAVAPRHPRGPSQRGPPSNPSSPVSGHRGAPGPMPSISGGGTGAGAGASPPGAGAGQQQAQRRASAYNIKQRPEWLADDEDWF